VESKAFTKQGFFDWPEGLRWADCLWISSVFGLEAYRRTGVEDVQSLACASGRLPRANKVATGVLAGATETGIRVPPCRRHQLISLFDSFSASTAFCTLNRMGNSIDRAHIVRNLSLKPPSFPEPDHIRIASLIAHLVKPPHFRSPWYSGSARPEHPSQFMSLQRLPHASQNGRPAQRTTFCTYYHEISQYGFPHGRSA